jgi:hypothetical protein
MEVKQMKNTNKRKTIDRWDIMTNYGYGWECECSEYTYKEAKERYKEYKENTNASVKLEKHREYK